MEKCKDIIIASVAFYNEKIKNEYNLIDNYVSILTEYADYFDYLSNEIDSDSFSVVIDERTNDIKIELSGIVLNVYQNLKIFCKLISNSLSFDIITDKYNEDYVVLSFTYPSVWTKRGC